jgi:hypothetical protein
VGIEANPYSEDGSLNSAGFSVRYDADTGEYLMNVPAAAGGAFYSDSNGEQYWSGTLQNASDYVGISVLKPGNPEQQFTYSSLAQYYTDGAWPGNYGWFAFGTATQPGAVPVTGSATYSALVRGSSLDGNGGIQGTATLNFNFGAGQLSGHFDPQYVSYGGIGDRIALGRYDFVNTVYAVGDTSFSGQLTNSAFGQNGSFTGRFTGPNAEELISSWSAPFHSPDTGQDSAMFGVWVGSRP